MSSDAMDAAGLPGKPSRSFSVGSLLLSVLFAYSALVQLNDHGLCASYFAGEQWLEMYGKQRLWSV